MHETGMNGVNCELEGKWSEQFFHFKRNEMGIVDNWNFSESAFELLGPDSGDIIELFC